MRTAIAQGYKTRMLGSVFFAMLLVLVLAAAFQLPRIVILQLGLPLPNYFLYLPLLGPLCVVVFYANAIYGRRVNAEGVSFDQMDLLFAIGIVGCVFLEIYHSALLESGENFGLIFSYIWGYLFFRLLCTFDRGILDRTTMIDVLIVFLTILSLLKLLSYLGSPALVSVSGFGLFRRQPVDALFLSEVSYRAVLCITLVLFSIDFSKFTPARLAYCGIALTINALLILASFTRGALLSVAILAILWVYKTKGLISVFILVAVGVAFEIVRAEFFSSPDSGAFFFIEELLSFGRGFRLSEESVEVRFQASVVAIEAFLNNPMLGIGYAGFNEVRYGLYITHTHYLHPLVSYGVVGTVPFVLVFATILFRCRSIISIEKLAYVIVFFVVLGVETYFRWWFGVIVFLIWTATGPPRPSVTTPPAVGSESAPENR